MDQNKSREVVLARINSALEGSATDPNLSEQNRIYEDLYADDTGNRVGLFMDSASELGVKVYSCLDLEEFRHYFQTLVSEKEWQKLNCMDDNLMRSLGLDTMAMDWTEDTFDCEGAITSCEVIVARTGTIVMSSSQLFGRVAPVHTPVHIVVVKEDQIVFDLPDAIEQIQVKYEEKIPSGLFFSSGVSSTGDIEKTLVRGVHGPEEVFVFLLPD